MVINHRLCILHRGFVTIFILLAVVAVLAAVDVYLVTHQHDRVPQAVQQQLSNNTNTTAILYPNGGEQWKVGKTYEIKWNPINYYGSVSISLLKQQMDFGIEMASLRIEKSVPNTGSYLWTIPESISLDSENSIDISSGNYYKIIVGSADSQRSNNFDASDDFFSIIH